jgi:peptidoglycan/LPS O-acetylase OafA/YrhL
MRLSYLEGLRGYMSIWVFFSHVLTVAALSFYKESVIGRILGNGEYPVIIFIILSGFVTHILLDSKKESYTTFLTRRAFRLFPIYLVCLVISIFMLDIVKDGLSGIIWENPDNLRRIIAVDTTKNNHFIVNIVSHLFLLHGLIPDNIIPASYTIMGQSWSLTLEWQFYLIIPLIHYFIVNINTLKANTVFMVSLAFVMVVSKIYMPQKTFIPNMLYYFGIGYFSYSCYKLYVKKIKPRGGG